MEVDDARRHWRTCSINGHSCHIVNRAIRTVGNKIDMKEVVVTVVFFSACVVTTTHAEKNLKMDKIGVTDEVRKKIQFGPLWGKRPLKGDIFGKNFMGPFEDKVKAMVDRGVDKGKRLSPAQMQEQLRINYPNRYDIPSVHNVNAHVKKCVRLYRENKRRAEEGLQAHGARFVMPERYAV